MQEDKHFGAGLEKLVTKKLGGKQDCRLWKD